MKICNFQLTKCLAVLLAAGGYAGMGAETSTNAAVKVAPPALVKAVFVDDAKLGRDPFFPNSDRRSRAAAEQNIITNVAPPPSAVFNQLALKGISGTKAMPLALINSATVAVGEVAEIRCSGRIVKIRCLEIRDRSVLIALDGGTETKELKLREGI